MPHIYVIDDDEAARESVLAVVKMKGFDGTGFSSAESFLSSFQPDWKGVIITDVRMPGMSGLEFLKEVQAQSIPLPVIVITGYGDIPHAVQAMKSGAFTFLQKPCQTQELASNIDQALEAGAAEHDRVRLKGELETRYQSLTDDERQVFDKLIEGLPNKRIASDLDIGLRTVELRRSNIMKKMGANSLAELVRMAITLDIAPDLLL